jgi:hypothetical protein
MKKILTAIALIMVLALSFVCIVACTSDNPNEQNPDDANKVTVSWYQGSKLLKEEKIEKGSKVTSWTPEAEDKTFTGWYAEASLTQAFDFDKAIEADTDIFAAFKSDEFVEDTNSYYLIGTGSGDMLKANWDHVNAEANLTMTKEDVAGANVYSITLTMYAGDMFQICFGGNWDGQVGIGLIEGAEYCDGVNFYDNMTYTAADKKVAQVKNADGEVVFIGSDEYNKGYEVWNAKLAEGMDGKYKITYTTYPNAGAYNKIAFELIEKIEPMTVTHSMHFVGEFNSWNASDENADFHMKEADDKATWSGFVTVTAEDLAADGTVEFKVVNQIGQSWYSPDGNNIVLNEAGVYAVKYTVDGNKVEIAKCDYYLVGTFVDGEGKAVNFAVKNGVTPSLTVADGVATGTLVATDVTAMGDYTWIADQGKPGVFAIKVVYGSELGVANWYGDEANGGDNWYVAAGTYTVSFDIEAKTVTITPAA